MRLDSSIADRISGLIFLTLGISMLVGGFVMDRLEIRQIHPASIPGLLPMGLGVAMIFCAVLLIVSTRHHPTTDTHDSFVENKSTGAQGSYKNLIVTAFLSVAYAAGLVGNISFVVATAIFIFVFSVYFLWPENKEGAQSKIRVISLCAVYAVVFATGISLLFRYAFLVRLP